MRFTPAAGFAYVFPKPFCSRAEMSGESEPIGADEVSGRSFPGFAPVRMAPCNRYQRIPQRTSPKIHGQKRDARPPVRHAITHRRIRAHVFRAEVKAPGRLAPGYEWHPKAGAAKSLTSSLFHKALRT
jgi:hypothetical protein